MKKHAAYWTTTGLFALLMTPSGLMTLSHHPAVAAGYAHLGYPAYFMTLLGAAKLAGVAALLAPGLPRLKEWAYAGFAINLASAAYSHASAGDGPGAAAWPLVVLALALASWRLRPAGRALPFAAREPAGLGAGRELVAS